MAAKRKSGPEPSADTATAAVSALQAQLAHAIGTLDSLDRKATLLPAVLVALAALLLPSDEMNAIQIGLAVAAVYFGILSVLKVARQVMPGDVDIGPGPAAMIQGMSEDSLAVFQERVAGSLADAVETAARINVQKAAALREAIRYAGWAMLFLVLTRFAGGIL